MFSQDHLHADPVNGEAIAALRQLPAPVVPDVAAGVRSRNVRKLKLNKSELPAALGRGMELQNAGQKDEAAAIYKAVLACDPENADALNLLAVILHEQGNNDLALHMLRKAVKRAPQIPPWCTAILVWCSTIWAR